MATNDKQIFPMIPERNWWVLRSQFRKAIPSTVTVTYLKSMLGLTTDQAARNIISPLKQIGLIDSNSKPTPRANDWRDDIKYKDVCEAIIKEVYPEELTDLFPTSEVNIDTAKRWFMNKNSVGTSAASKAASMFVLLKSGKIKSDTEKTSQSIIKKTTVEKKKKESMATIDKQVSESMTTTTQTSSMMESSNNTPTLHIDLQIHISPDASPEQIDSIFASMAKHLYGKTNN